VPDAQRHVKSFRAKNKTIKKGERKMLRGKKTKTLIILATALLLLTVYAAAMVKAEDTQQTAKIWTDKADYSPEETVKIFGTGFLPESTITIEVTRPDLTVEIWSVTSGLDGSFTTAYLLDGITGTYTVTATDGTNTATTTFTDTPTKPVKITTTYGGSVAYSYDSTTGTVAPAATLTLEVAPGTFITFNAIAQEGYSFAGWSGDLSGTTTQQTINVGNGLSITASFSAISYTVTFTESGLPSGTEWSVTFNSVSKSSTTDTITFTGVSAGSYSWSVSTPVSGGTGVRYIASPSSGTMNVPSQTSQSITYTTQYYLTVNTNPSGIDSPTGEGWYDALATAHVSAAQYVDIVPGSSRYRFDSWTGASGTYSDATVLMDSAKTVTANYVTQFYVTFAQSGVGTDFTGTVMTVGGTDYDRGGHSDWYDEGASITFSYASPLVVSDNAKRYVLSGIDASSPLTVSSSCTITGSYDTQYYLTVNSAYDTLGGGGWYDSGGTAYATLAVGEVISDGTKYVFTGWSGDASGSGLTSGPITMDGPKTATANWDTYYLVHYAANVPVTVPDDEWVKSGQPATGTFPSQVVSDGTKYVYVSDNRPPTITAPTTITATYDTYYRVKIDWSGLDADASGKVATITVGGASIVENAGDGYYDEWLEAGTTLSYSFETTVSSSMPYKVYKLVSVTGTSTAAYHYFGAISGPISETGNYGSIILSITKKAPSAVFVGDTIRYIYGVTNTGTTSATGITVTDGTLTVTFVGGDVNGNNALDPRETWVYTATYGPVPARDKPSITNTAELSCSEGAKAQDTAIVEVYELEVSKTAETWFTRTYDWTISKTADPSSLIFSSGTDTQTVKYSIALSATYKDSDWRVTGTITIHNPAPIPAVITSIKDVVSPDIAAKIDFGSVTFPYTLGAGKTLTLTYSADLPNADSRTNTVTVTIQNYERPFLWDLTGDWVIRVHYGGTYDHDFSLTMASDGLAFTGTGGYPASGPPYSITETITGVTAVNDVFWHSLYNNGYFWDAKGTVAPDGKMSGTWTSSAGQSGTWESISGAAKLVKTETTTSDLTATAAVVFGEPTTKIDECVTVTDTYSGGPQGVTVAYPGETLTYDRVIGPYANIGIYTVENTASFVTCDTETTGSDDCVVTVYRIGSAVTTSSFYLFDFDNADGRQFKLIYTPDVPTYPSLYRLTASNPGQFYYNIFYYGGVSTPFTITIPEPFVTQGANPVHIYDSIGTSGDYLLPAGNDITYLFTITPTYSEGGDFTGFIVKPNDGYSGPVYITIHLDYGYKTLGGLSKDDSNNAFIDSTIKIKDLTVYTFSVSGPLTDSDTVENRNVFKCDPGFVGLITDSEGNPIEGVKVQIYGPDGKLLATVYTDKDGWYFYNYKYTGKAASFTIKLPEYNKTATVTIKSNSLTKTDFIIP
jgi:uncharacterized repeat protein (TIGR02543 family)